ncbi:receptor-interacting serine/threonine-protein kinase 3-like isoform X1 [Hyperolius riggenbachi]|uniref:receptor-interacting serine/threonine-protein kinase 3-like isoform X1 n=1 Tax=Hyperolius riggenbachi TaxID=752182 RepID=UPI0035A34FE6
MHLLPYGDLENLELVGSGGFGCVYKGWSRRLQMEVALKMIQGAHSSNMKKLMKGLMKERDVMQKASSPHVLRLLGVYEKPEGKLLELGLVMEFMPNGSLRSLFDNIPDVPWALKFQILHQVVLGMNYLHSMDPPIIHRDLKPCNVLLNKYLDVQITDFGLSKIAGATTSATPSFAGTLSYMPPEALNDINYEITRTFDVYSFAILTWTVFSSVEPYLGIPAPVIQRCVCEGQRPRASDLDRYEHIKMVPKAKELMIRCWDHNPGRRPSFHDCSESTTVMYEAYQEEIVSAVRSVQDFVQQSSSASPLCEVTELITGYSEEFLKALAKNVEMTPDTQESSCPVGNGEVSEPETAMVKSETPPEDEEDISGAEAFGNTLFTAIKNSGDYKKIMGKLQDSGVEKDLQKLNNPKILQKKLGRLFR